MTIHEQEEQIFNEWKEAIARNTNKNVDNINLVPDGLLNKGEITYMNNCWGREPGNEEQLWKEIFPRVMFLTKDQNDKDKNEENEEAGWDIRKETGRTNATGKEHIQIASLFYYNYMLWLYGLHHTKMEGYPPFNDIKDPDTIRPFFDQTPVVRMNVKKEVGGSSLSNNTLQDNLNKYKDFIVKQMALYDADIIVCCGGQSLLKNFVLDNYLPDLHPYVMGNGEWIYWSEKKHKVVIDSYHPSYWGLCREDMYTGLVENYRMFLREHPSFSHR